jgi:hypothetical protein
VCGEGIKEARDSRGKDGVAAPGVGRWGASASGERVGRAETSRVRQLPNDGVVSARVIDVGSWPRKNRGNPEGFRASKGALRVEKICLGYDLPVERY